MERKTCCCLLEFSSHLTASTNPGATPAPFTEQALDQPSTGTLPSDPTTQRVTKGPCTHFTDGETDLERERNLSWVQGETQTLELSPLSKAPFLGPHVACRSTPSSMPLLYTPLTRHCQKAPLQSNSKPGDRQLCFCFTCKFRAQFPPERHREVKYLFGCAVLISACGI